MDTVTASRRLSISATSASELFWDIQRWQQIWSPIEQVEVRYDDGRHQEFVMAVRRDKQRETVRTIRFRRPDRSIAFFSPLSPPMMSYHRGLWRFEPEERECRVTAYREYALTCRDGESATAYDARRAAFATAFRARLRRIFDRFGEHFDLARAGRRAGADLPPAPALTQADRGGTR